MQRWILIIIVGGLVGYAVYDFAIPKETKKEEIESSGGQLTSAPGPSDSEEGSSEEPEGEAEVGLRVGNLAPDFELETLTGDVVKLSDYRGKKVMVNFWATWCPPCRAEIPDMQKFYEKHDIEILAINLTETEPSRGQVNGFVDEFGMTFPVLLDNDLTVAEDTYKIQPIPSSFFIDTKGIIRFYAPGALHYEHMVSEFEKLN